ncbi:MAG: response regulator [Myxococcales bacterium]
MVTLLLVEDDPDAGEATREELAGAGFQVEVASDAAQALARLEQEPFGALVVDLRLPGLDGADLLARLRADPRHQDLPVVIHTATPMTARLRPRLAGASGVVQKAGKPAPLLEAVQRALSARPTGGPNTWLLEP